MTDKEKIRAEIERLKKYAEESKMEWIDDGYNQNAFAETCRISSFDKLLSFIDSLPEPSCPKESDDLEEAIDAEIVKDIHNLLHVKSGPLPKPAKHLFGDRVKIIILRDNERTQHNMD